MPIKDGLNEAEIQAKLAREQAIFKTGIIAGLTMVEHLLAHPLAELAAFQPDLIKKSVAGMKADVESGQVEIHFMEVDKEDIFDE